MSQKSSTEKKRHKFAPYENDMRSPRVRAAKEKWEAEYRERMRQAQQAADGYEEPQRD